MKSALDILYSRQLNIGAQLKTEQSQLTELMDQASKINDNIYQFQLAIQQIQEAIVILEKNNLGELNESVTARSIRKSKKTES